MILGKYHLEYIVIIPIKEQVDNGGYFSHSIINFFLEVPKHVEFLNKFYQCLLHGQLPHEAKKAVVCGTNNSGKSSCGRIFFGLMNRLKIVSVLKEKTFGLSTMDEDTELTFIDEWS